MFRYRGENENVPRPEKNYYCLPLQSGGFKDISWPDGIYLPCSMFVLQWHPTEVKHRRSPQADNAIIIPNFNVNMLNTAAAKFNIHNWWRQRRKIIAVFWRSVTQWCSELRKDNFLKMLQLRCWENGDKLSGNIWALFQRRWWKSCNCNVSNKKARV